MGQLPDPIALNRSLGLADYKHDAQLAYEGSRQVRVMFWRRKNARLAARLSNIIVRSEEVRKAYRPKPPRVIIDTSFVDQQYGVLHGYDAAEDGAASYPSETTGQSVECLDGGPDAASASAHPNAPQPQSTRRRRARLRMSPAHIEAWQSDLSTRRGAQTPPHEAEAHGEPEPARSDICPPPLELGKEPETYALQSAAHTLEAAGLRETAPAAQREAELQRELAARLEAETLREEAARQAVEAEREKAARREAALQKELSELKSATEAREEQARREAEVRLKNEVARREAEAQRELAARLQAEAKREADARRAAEMEREEASRRAAELERQLAAMRAEAEASEAAARREAEARRVEIEARRVAEAERQEAIRREALALKQAEAREWAEAEREAAARREAEALRELEALREEARKREEEARQEAEARVREEVSRREAEARREMAAQIEEAALREAETRRQLEVERQETARREEAAQRELEAMREAARVREEQSRRQSEEHEEALARIEAEAAAIAREEAERDRARREDEEQSAKLAAIAAEAEALRLMAAQAEQESRRSDNKATERALARVEAAEPLDADQVSAGLARLKSKLRSATKRQAVTGHTAQTPPPVTTETGSQAEEPGPVETPVQLTTEAPLIIASPVEQAKPGSSVTSAIPPVVAPKSLAPTEAQGGDESAAKADRADAQSAAASKPEAALEAPAAVPQHKPARARISVDLDAANNVGSPVPPRAKGFVVMAAEPVAELTPEQKKEERERAKRKERRVAAQTPAQLWREGMTPLTCVIRDRSPSGAMLDFGRDRFREEITEVSVGDKLTLSMSNSRERTSVLCVVMRITGRRCGVKFCGQFVTEPIRPKTSAKERVSAGGKAAKSRFALDKG